MKWLGIFDFMTDGMPFFTVNAKISPFTYD
jgi:hypothetical protein